MNEVQVMWGQSPIWLSWHPDCKPVRELITSVHCFCFHEDQLMIVKLNHRGWDFPGGHLENGESIEQCVAREAYEEGYIAGTATYLGAVQVDHRDNPFWNENSPYPKTGYQAFFRIDITKLHPFAAEFESAERLFIEPGTIQKFYLNWHDIYESILQQALTVDQTA